jgi:hypothetical protein
LKTITQSLERMLAKEKITQDQMDETLGRITFSTDVATFEGVPFLFEAVFENVGVKKELFERSDIGGRWMTSGGCLFMVSPCTGAALRLGIRLRKHVQVEFLVEHRQVALRCGGEQFGGHRGQDAVVAGRVVAQGMTQRRRHEAGVAGAGKQVFEAGEQLVAAGVFGGEAGADPAAQRHEFFAAQLFDEPGITGDDGA